MVFYGKLKRDFSENGYSFIVRDDGNGDDFCHIKAVRPGVKIEAGDAVKEAYLPIIR